MQATRAPPACGRAPSKEAEAASFGAYRLRGPLRNAGVLESPGAQSRLFTSKSVEKETLSGAFSVRRPSSRLASEMTAVPLQRLAQHRRLGSALRGVRLAFKVVGDRSVIGTGRRHRWGSWIVGLLHVASVTLSVLVGRDGLRGASLRGPPGLSGHPWCRPSWPSSLLQGQRSGSWPVRASVRGSSAGGGPKVGLTSAFDRRSCGELPLMGFAKVQPVPCARHGHAGSSPST